MSQYSFLDELIIAETIVLDLRDALYTKDSAKVIYICRQLHNSAARILRKVEKYEAFREHAEAVAPWTKGTTFIEFDNPTGKEQK